MCKEIYQEEIMTARNWVEFGKMFNNMTVDGLYVDLISTNTYEDNEFVIYYINLSNDEEDWNNEEFGFKSPYLAIKHAYFEYFLEIESENIQLDIPDEQLSELYKIADKEGITIDEVVIRMLQKNIEEECCCGTDQEDEPEIYEAECCNNCESLEWIDTDHPTCIHHDVKVKRNLLCDDWSPQID